MALQQQPRYFEAIVPEDGINRVLNPSGEGGTDVTRLHWKTVGPSTVVTRILDGADLGSGVVGKARHGRAAWRLVSTSTGQGLVLELDTAPNLQQTLSFWARPAQAGGALPTTLRLGVGVYSSATISTEVTANLIETDGNGWVRYAYTFSSTQCNGKDAAFILTSNTGPVAADLFIDGVLLEEGAEASIYFDGESGPGHRWDYSAYDSRSLRRKRRPDDTPNIGSGFIYWVDNGTTVLCNLAVGIGIPPIKHMVNENAAGHGGVYQTARIDPRDLVLNFSLIGTSVAHLHSLRYQLMKYFQVGDPFVLRYHGADAIYEITVVYAGGMEFGEVIGGTKQKIAVRLTAYDPFFRDLSASTVALTVSASATHSYLSILQEGVWTAPSGLPAPIAKVYVAPDQTVYVGTEAEAGTAYLYRRTRTGWTQMATVTGTLGGVGPVINDIVQSLDGLYLYVTGHFTQVGGVTYNGLFKVTVASPYTVSHIVAGSTNFSGGGGYALALHPSSSKLYVAGGFTQCNGVEHRRALLITNLDATPAFSVLYGGLDGTAYAVAVNAQGEAFYGGAFTAGSKMDQIAATPTQVQIAGSLNWSVTRQYCYVGIDKDGKYSGTSSVSGPSANGWAGSRVTLTRIWGAVSYLLICFDSSGTQGQVAATIPDPGTGTTFTFDHTSQAYNTGATFYAYTSVGTTATPKIAKYSPTLDKFVTVGQSGFNGTVYALALAPDNLTLYAAGPFTVADGNAAAGAAMLIGAIWTPLGSGLTGTPYTIAIATDSSVWFGGAITAAGGSTLAVGVARWVGGEYGGNWLHALIAFPSNTTVKSLALRYDDLLVGHDRSASIASAGATTFTYAGTSDGYPIVEVGGPIVLQGFLKYPADWLLTDLTVYAGEVVRLDMRPGRKLVTSSNPARGNLSQKIKPGSQTATFRTPPGSVKLLAFGTGTDANTYVRLIDQGSYLSGDGAS